MTVASQSRDRKNSLDHEIGTNSLTPLDVAEERPRFHYRYRLRLTRLGYHFLFVALFAMIGGSIRGFNLLLVLAGLLMSVILVQWRSGLAMIRPGLVLRRLPTEVFAGEPFEVRYSIRNQSRWIPMWMLRISDLMTQHRTGSRSHRAKQSPLRSAAGLVAPKSISQSRCKCLVTERGRYRFGPIQLSTSFPFSLLESRKQFVRVDAEDELVMFPQILSLHPSWSRRLPSLMEGANHAASRAGPTDGDFFGLRSWQNGDSARWIHWRTSARLGEPAVCQFEQTNRRRVTIVLDGGVPSASESVGTLSVHEQFEMAVALAVTLGIKISSIVENQLSMAIASQTPQYIRWNRIRSDRRIWLTALADVTYCKGKDRIHLLQETLKAIAMQSGHTDDLIVVSCRPMELVIDDGSGITAGASSISSELGRTPEGQSVGDSTASVSVSSLLGGWQRRRRLTWININEEIANQTLLTGRYSRSEYEPEVIGKL